MWHETLYEVLNIINTVILTLIGIPFMVQVIYMLFFWVKKKVYPKSDKKGKAAFLIAARNEEKVIFETVRFLKEHLNYPKDKYDIYVICHNCTDRTKELAEKAGAYTMVLNDPDPKKRKMAYPLQLGFNTLMKEELGYDFVIRLDADNRVNPDFLNYMNDAYQSGVEYARPYESSLNLKQSVYSKVCSLYYVFDSRFGSRVRERLKLAAHVNGPGALISTRVLREVNAFNCTSSSEDLEFEIELLLKKVYGHFVEDAVVYEDMPANFKDTYNRNKRMAAGVRSLTFSHTLKLLFFGIFKFRLSYLEIFTSISFMLVCLVCCIYLPLFYVYDVTYLSLIHTGIIQVSAQPVSYYSGILWQTLIIAAVAISVLFLLCGVLQGVILVCLDYKKMGADNRKELMGAALLFPLFTVVYIITIALGLFSKGSWKEQKRSMANDSNDAKTSSNAIVPVNITIQPIDDVNLIEDSKDQITKV